MRVCPKCGYHDPWYWRGSSVVVGLEYCKLSDFQEDYPQIATELINTQKEGGAKNFVFDKDYCYHLTKGMNVERQSLIENPNPKTHWHIPTEAHNKPNVAFGLNPLHHGEKLHTYNKAPNQTKLLEVSE